MNIVAQANDLSTQYKFCTENASETNPFPYYFGKNVPRYSTMARVNQLCNPSAITGINQTAVYSMQVPRYAILDQIYLRVDIGTGNIGGIGGAGNITGTLTGVTGGQTRQTAPYSGAYLFSQIELRARDRIIATVLPEAFIQDVNSEKNNQNQEVLLRGLNGYSIPLIGTNVLGAFISPSVLGSNITVAPASGGFVYWTMRIPFTQCKWLKQALYTKFCEPLELRLYKSNWVAAASTTLGQLGVLPPVAADGGVVYPTATTYNIQVGYDFILPDAAHEEMLKEQMVSAGPEGIPQLHSSWYRESVGQILNTTAEQFFDIRCPYPTLLTTLNVRMANTANAVTDFITGNYTTTNTDTWASYINYLSVFVQQIRVVSSGVELYKGTPQELLVRMNCHERRSITAFSAENTTAANTSSYYSQGVLNWGLGDDGSEQTGFMSFKNLARPQIGITLLQSAVTLAGNLAIAPGALFLNLYVAQQYQLFTQVASDDGRVEAKVLE